MDMREHAQSNANQEIEQLAPSAPRLLVTCVIEGGVWIASLKGDLDNHTTGIIFGALTGAPRRSCSAMLVDMTDIRTVTRAGLRSLVVAAKLVQVSGGRMRIVVTNAEIERHIRGLSLNHLMVVDRSYGAAWRALAKSGAPPAAGTGLTYSHAEILSQPTPNQEAWP